MSFLPVKSQVMTQVEKELFEHGVFRAFKDLGLTFSKGGRCIEEKSPERLSRVDFMGKEGHTLRSGRSCDQAITGCPRGFKKY